VNLDEPVNSDAANAYFAANTLQSRFLNIKVGVDTHFSSVKGDRAPDIQKNRHGRLWLKSLFCQS